MNRRLEGWANYFCLGSLYGPYRVIDRYAGDRLRRFLVRRHKVPERGTRRFSYRYLHGTLGLVRLRDRRRVPTWHAVT